MKARMNVEHSFPRASRIPTHTHSRNSGISRISGIFPERRRTSQGAWCFDPILEFPEFPEFLECVCEGILLTLWGACFTSCWLQSRNRRPTVYLYTRSGPTHTHIPKIPEFPEFPESSWSSPAKGQPCMKLVSWLARGRALNTNLQISFQNEISKWNVCGTVVEPPMYCWLAGWTFLTVERCRGVSYYKALASKHTHISFWNFILKWNDG